MYVVTIDTELCNGCGDCVKICPNNVLALKDGKSVVVNDDCLGCQSCEQTCPTKAIKVEEF